MEIGIISVSSSSAIYNSTKQTLNCFNLFWPMASSCDVIFDIGTVIIIGIYEAALGEGASVR
jgi:hypothetical protein